MRHLLTRLALACLALATVAGSAQAQDRSGTPGEFDFYVLSLSWSPGFCESTGAARGSPQCDQGRGLGFVVHGLWPQYERGYPSGCGADRALPRNVIEEFRGLYPDEGLARHEWRTHGTCSGLSPSAYLTAVRTARDKVTVPDPLRNLQAEGRTTGQSIERAFAETNPGLRPDEMAVTCRRGALEEVRICLDRDLRGFRPCPEVNRDRSCGFGPVRVPAPR